VAGLWTPRGRAALVGVLGLVGLGTWVVLAVQVTLPADNTGWYIAGVMLPCLAVSVLLLARLPGSAVTRVVTILTLCHLELIVSDAVRLWRAEHGGPAYNHLAPGLGSGVLGWLDTWLPWWSGTLPLLPVLLVVFPDGVARQGLWRFVFWGQMLSLAVMV
jgi:hypothetical protein